MSNEDFKKNVEKHIETVIIGIALITSVTMMVVALTEKTEVCKDSIIEVGGCDAEGVCGYRTLKGVLSKKPYPVKGEKLNCDKK